MVQILAWWASQKILQVVGLSSWMMHRQRKNFYRVKLSTAQTSYYSSIISATPSADASCKFYPNPVDKVLIVKVNWGLIYKYQMGPASL